jgi:hypothetical protein
MLQTLRGGPAAMSRVSAPAADAPAVESRAHRRGSHNRETGRRRHHPNRMNTRPEHTPLWYSSFGTSDRTGLSKEMP